MSGLREALEKLCDRNARTLAPHPGMRLDVSVMELRRLLAAHPAEPAPVANREQVASDVREALNANAWVTPGNLDEATSDVVEFLLTAGVFRDEATVKAEAWDEGYARGMADHCDYYPSADGCDTGSTNPHRAGEPS